MPRLSRNPDLWLWLTLGAGLLFGATYVRRELDRHAEDVEHAKRVAYERKRRELWLPEDELPSETLEPLLHHPTPTVRRTTIAIIESRSDRLDLLAQFKYQQAHPQPPSHPKSTTPPGNPRAIFHAVQAQPAGSLDNPQRAYIFATLQRTDADTLADPQVTADDALVEIEIRGQLREMGVTNEAQLREAYAREEIADVEQTVADIEGPGRAFETVEDAVHGITARVPRGEDGSRRHREAVVFTSEDAIVTDLDVDVDDNGDVIMGGDVNAGLGAGEDMNTEAIDEAIDR